MEAERRPRAPEGARWPPSASGWMPRPWAAACRLLTLAWLPTPTPLTLPTLLLPTLTTMLLLLLMPLLLLLLLLPLRRWPAIQARLCSAGGFKCKSGVPTCR